MSSSDRLQSNREPLNPDDEAAYDFKEIPSAESAQTSRSVGFDASVGPSPTLTPDEVMQIRRMLKQTSLHRSYALSPTQSMSTIGADSEYSEFHATTHAWAVYSDNPLRRATILDRSVGTFIIVFQLFTYYLFAAEAIEDYERGAVPVLVTHRNCLASGLEPVENFQCDAEWTNNFDAAVAFFTLSVFLTPDLLQAFRAIQSACNMIHVSKPTIFFACLAAVEVLGAFLGAAIAISYQLYIGEVTDAIEVGVGLLFIRELSARAYAGIRNKGTNKEYRSFGLMLACLITAGFLVEAWCQIFAKRALEEQN